MAVDEDTGNRDMKCKTTDCSGVQSGRSNYCSECLSAERCSVENCWGTNFSKTLCREHYKDTNRQPIAQCDRGCNQGVRGNSEYCKTCHEDHDGVCAEKGCSGKSSRKFLCQRHYQLTLGTCKVKGCTKGVHGGGMCGNHWRAKRLSEAPDCITAACANPQSYVELKLCGTCYEAHHIKNADECATTGCSSPQHANSVCKYCNSQARRNKIKTSMQEHNMPLNYRAVIRYLYKQCVKCDSKDNLEVDHIVPVSKGGATSWQNLQLLCQACHYTKGYDSTDYRDYIKTPVEGKYEFVYVMQNEVTKEYKVGMTQRVNVRTLEISYEINQPVVLLDYWRAHNASEAEQKIHALLQEHSTYSEWFDCDYSTVRAAVASVVTHPTLIDNPKKNIKHANSNSRPIGKNVQP